MAEPNTNPLLRAFHFIVTAELSDPKIKVRILGTEQKRANMLGKRWKILQSKLDAVVHNCTQQLKAKIVNVCNEALEETIGVEVQFDVSACEKLLAGIPTADGFAETEAGETYAYLFDQFIFGSNTWKGFDQVYAAANTECVKLLNNCQEIEKFIIDRLVEQDKEYLKCVGLIDKVQERINTLSSEPDLGGELTQLIFDGTALLNERMRVLDLCSRTMLKDRCTALSFTFTDPKGDNNLIISQAWWPLYNYCENTWIDCKELQNGIAPAVFKGLREAKVNIKYFSMLLKELGWLGFKALLRLDAAEQKTLVDWWSGLSSNFLNKCPAGSSSEEILLYYKVVLTSKGLTDALWNIMKETIPKIDIPGKCIPHGWKMINGTGMPAAFSTSSFSTDQSCMKHSKEELGIAPSPAKIQAYFAELVTACEQAVETWKNNGKKDMYPVTVNCHVASWTIMVGSKGSPTIHHIDSGYATNSAWVNRTV